jgi:NTE family protein
VIRPELATMKGNDFNGRGTAIIAGEKAALAVLNELRQKLKARRGN